MRFTLYTKPECGLCDDAKQVLAQFRKECAFDLELVNIETDPAVFERYKYDIPVLAINGHEAAKHVLNLKKLRILVQRNSS